MMNPILEQQKRELEKIIEDMLIIMKKHGYLAEC